MITKAEPDFATGLATLDEKLGAGFVQNLTSGVGTEAAFAVTGLSTSGPTWVLAIVANNQWLIDSSVAKLVEAFNAELGPDEQGKRIVFEQESANGRTWNTLKPGGLPLGITWTYDAGYMVAASDRAVAERAIATRNGGSQLVWSPDFLGQLPSSAGLHPSGFAWLNTKGAFATLAPLAPSPAFAELMAEARFDSGGIRWIGGTDPCGQPYSYLGIDHGPDAHRALEPGDRRRRPDPLPENFWTRYRLLN